MDNYAEQGLPKMEQTLQAYVFILVMGNAYLNQLVDAKFAQIEY